MPDGRRRLPRARTAGSASRVHRRAMVVAVLAGAVPLLALGSLALGSNPVSPPAVWSALTHPTGADADVIVRTLRLPRTALAMVVGCCLGVAGVLMQGHTRNPLADPGLLGVSAGSAFTVVIGLRTGLVDSLQDSVVAALVGALAVSALVFRLARSALNDGGARLVVAGAAVTAMLAAATSAVVLLDAQTLDSYRFWAVGSLAGRGSGVTLAVLPVAVLGLALAIANARSLDLLTLGPELAHIMGVSVSRARLIGVGAVSLLTAAAVAACGPIAFVGLLAGHLARAISGPHWLRATTAAALGGILVLLTADIAGRLVGGPGELQVGVVAGVLGGPLLIWVVRRRSLVL